MASRLFDRPPWTSVGLTLHVLQDPLPVEVPSLSESWCVPEGAMFVHFLRRVLGPVDDDVELEIRSALPCTMPTRPESP